MVLSNSLIKEFDSSECGDNKLIENNFYSINLINLIVFIVE